jgi:hypothetical protein
MDGPEQLARSRSEPVTRGIMQRKFVAVHPDAARLEGAAHMMSRPVVVSPVKAILAMRLLLARGLPVTRVMFS